MIVYFNSRALWKACLVSDHVIKEAHSVFKSVNALYLSHEGEEINSVKGFLPSHVKIASAVMNFGVGAK